MIEESLLGFRCISVVVSLYLIFLLCRWFIRIRRKSKVDFWSSHNAAPQVKKKYILYGGYIQSSTDGQSHYISARMLCNLYGLNPEECYFYNSNEKGIRKNKKSYPDLPVLFPRSDGNYKLPLEGLKKD